MGAAKARARALAMAAPHRRRPAVVPPGILRRPEGQPSFGERRLESGARGDSDARAPIGMARGGPLCIGQGAVYYLKECQISGRSGQVEVRDGEVYREALLKFHTGRPDLRYHLRLCRPGCNQQEVSDQLIHVTKIRRVLDVEKEEGWLENLQKVVPLT